jgi:hypothetical protein
MPSQLRSSAIPVIGVLALVVGGVGATTAEARVAHRNPCHSAHTCPSDHHTYVWQGLSCTSYADERLPSDTRRVVVGGRIYWCHRGSGSASGGGSQGTSPPVVNRPVLAGPRTITAARASRLLARLEVRAPHSMAGYSRDQFGPAWKDVDQNGCDTRDDILRRDLKRIRLRAGSSCIVQSGVLSDPYTGRLIRFLRGVRTSSAVQIDHVVALGDAWRTGAAGWTFARRLAYDGPENEAKGDDDASQWLPPNRGYDCRYIKQQITIKTTYSLWVTRAEHDAMARQLPGC